MRLFWGRTFLSWIISIVAAFAVFFIVVWLLPKLGTALSFPIPDDVVKVLALLLALITLAYNFMPTKTPVAPSA